VQTQPQPAQQQPIQQQPAPQLAQPVQPQLTPQQPNVQTQPQAAQPQQSIQPQEQSVQLRDAPERTEKPLRDAIESLFRKVDPERARVLPREMNANAVARELSEAVSLLYERLESAPEDSPRHNALRTAAAELDQSARFLNQVNNFAVTVPLQWGEKRTTAELYVFNDGDGKKVIDPQNATVFVSLMTANAGRVETLIKVLGKNVECDFKTELPETVGAVESGMPTLAGLLDSQGYRLARTSVAEANRASDIFDVRRIREENKARYFFDRKV
jgi:hypothetical protein